ADQGAGASLDRMRARRPAGKALKGGGVQQRGRSCGLPPRAVRATARQPGSGAAVATPALANGSALGACTRCRLGGRLALGVAARAERAGGHALAHRRVAEDLNASAVFTEV